MTAAPSNFWARRRAAVAAEEAALAAADAERAARQQAEALTRAQEDKPDEVVLEELGLKDPDQMEMGDDFSAFLQKAVPEHLRRRALRRLWRSNPVLANLDGLVDFGEDFTDAAMVKPDMKTTYQVGKGLLQHVEALARAAEKTVENEPTEEPPTITSALAQDAGMAEPVTEGSATGAALVPAEDAPEEQAEALPRRHMRFTFDDARTA